MGWAKIEDTLDPQHKFHRAHVDATAVKLMLPIYFTNAKLTKDDIMLAKNSWDIIATGTCPKFVFSKLTFKEKFPFESAVSWFQSVYFNRLFDVHPLCRGMFIDCRAQGRFFSSLLGFIFTALVNENNFKKRLTALAISHCRMGVKAIEYGIIGEVMFWALKTCLDELYDKDTHKAWVKLFSAMIAVIVPVAVSYELESNAAQVERMHVQATSHGYSYRSHAKGDSKDGYSQGKLSVIPDMQEEITHTSGSITRWERTHKHQGHTMVDVIDCYS